MTASSPRCTFSPPTPTRREVLGATATVAVSLAAGIELPISRREALAQTPSPAGEPLALDFTAVATGLQRPLFMTHAGDGSGRLYVVEQPGRVRIVADGQAEPTPFLDITDRVGSSGSEQGLLGLAFAPDFSSSSAFYVDYTDANGNTVVSRFTASDAMSADAASEEIILQQEQPYPNHNGGDIAFGPDGLLYISFGDGGGQGDPNGNGQSLDTWLGKILRIDVSQANGETPYAVPPENPFVETAGAKPEILFYGLRNPWRFSFDRETGDLWIGDVGQNTYEEIDMIASADVAVGGQNFGWNIMEGDSCYNADTCDQDGLAMPVFVYSHAEGGCSVTGGYVYRGAASPALAGTYLCGDYCSGLIWGLRRDTGGAWVASPPVESGYSISSFGQDEAGELYLADLSGGSVYRIAAG